MTDDIGEARAGFEAHLDDLQANPPTRLTERQRRLLWEAVTMVDRDTLNDNLERVNVNMTTNDEMFELAEELDRSGEFADEWERLSDQASGSSE